MMFNYLKQLFKLLTKRALKYNLNGTKLLTVHKMTA